MSGVAAGPVLADGVIYVGALDGKLDEIKREVSPATAPLVGSNTPSV